MILNLTPHEVNVFARKQFTNLSQVNATTWIADNVAGEPLATYLPYYHDGGSARIAVITKSYNLPTPLAGEIVQTSYEELTGIPEVSETDILIVSSQMLAFCKEAGLPIAKMMFAPYRVVRLASNTARVLGCMGFTK